MEVFGGVQAQEESKRSKASIPMLDLSIISGPQSQGQGGEVQPNNEDDFLMQWN
jgi:hypothetical protein